MYIAQNTFLKLISMCWTLIHGEAISITMNFIFHTMNIIINIEFIYVEIYFSAFLNHMNWYVQLNECMIYGELIDKCNWTHNFVLIVDYIILHCILNTMIFLTSCTLCKTACLSITCCFIVISGEINLVRKGESITVQIISLHFWCNKYSISVYILEFSLLVISNLGNSCWVNWNQIRQL